MKNHWLDRGRATGLPGLLFLHLKVRSCHASQVAGAERLTVAAGPKQGATAATVYSMVYNLRVEARTADYLRVTLAAPLCAGRARFAGT